MKRIAGCTIAALAIAAAAAAQQAAILGDTSTALAKLRSAKSLDPGDADIAYQLARVYESAGNSDSATTEYCRFLSLGPNATDATDARARLTVIAKPTNDPAIERANAAFADGVAAYDGGRMVEAEEHFSVAIAAQPTWADAYYDRALARRAQGNRQQASNDLELYLRINTAAPDRDAVTTEIAALTQSRLSAGQAFSLGVVIPGGGQFYTHRRILGSMVLLATAGGVAYAVTPETTTSTGTATGIDPFGNSYSYPVTLHNSARPHLVAGLAVAGGVALIGAIEAAVYTNHIGDSARRLSLFIVPGRSLLAARVAF